MISIKDVSFTYAGASAPALSNINLQVEDGDFVGIIGESGAGKTTLGHIINGIVPHYYKGDYFGRVEVNGMDTFEVALTDLSQAVGTVSQDIDNQMVAGVVEDEVLYGLENFGVPFEEIEARLAGALESVGISDLRQRTISTLSGGQKQKVAVASIIAIAPNIIVLDEPTAELDPQSSRQIFELLRALNEQGMTVVVIEQKVMLLCEFARRIVLMDHGQVVLDEDVPGALQRLEVMERYGVNCPRVASLCKRLNARQIGSGQVVSDVEFAAPYIQEILEGANVSAGQEHKPQVAQEPQAAGETVLRFQNVNFAYKDREVLHDLNFEVRRGEFVAILGPNGTGKSTTSRLINGLLQPSAGSVEVLGMNTANTPSSKIAHHVGFLFQNPDRQICQTTTREEIAFGLKSLGYSASEIEERTRATLELMHLAPEADPFNLSKGQRQAVALASLIAVQPELLILDEPTTGFDFAECCEAMRCVKRLNEAGTTVFMVCHDMEVVLDYASRALVMAGGRIIADAPVREVFQMTEVLREAALLPPQINELSQRLAPAYPQLANIFGIDEMADAIQKAVS